MLKKFVGIMAKQYFRIAAMKPERKEKRAVGNPCDDAHLWGGIGQWTAGLVLFVDGE